MWHLFMELAHCSSGQRKQPPQPRVRNRSQSADKVWRLPQNTRSLAECENEQPVGVRAGLQNLFLAMQARLPCSEQRARRGRLFVCIQGGLLVSPR